MFAPYHTEEQKYNMKTIENLRHTEYLEKLERRLENRKTKEQIFNHKNSLEFPLPVIHDKKSYAQELVKQIAEKEIRKKQEEIDKQKPAISENFSGYPNLPQTPPQIRRERELARKKKVKDELEQQIYDKNNRAQSNKSHEIEHEKEQNHKVLRKIEEDQQAKILKKNHEREVLLDSWQKSSKSKEIKNLIKNLDEKIFKPRSNSITTKAQANFSPVPQSNFINTSSITQLKSIEKPNCTDKSTQILEKMDKRHESSYQIRIKKLMKNVKESRNVISSSLSPKNFLAKIKFPLKKAKFLKAN
ncbi:hypothetical protein SteCoe_24482 [Stentor coeruleus]|uniref:Uncharacterized protein n=1 Tax=Stentor coeruleus TaxID=5963 RepID=A0A1R2BHD4_9CILI|nr:hypothetical protein SteCoe_24482 [Stentor coeruleus]